MSDRREEVSIMCPDCWRLVGGVPAGNHVRWQFCGDDRCVEPSEQSWKLIWRLLVNRILSWRWLASRTKP